jgi:phosphoadenosine phosphosulfate reductase
VLALTPPQIHADDLSREISLRPTLDARLAYIADAIEGRIAFSTSLGLEDQAILHAIATSGANIDVFTLDTGRHFPETLDTIERSERRYGLKIRVMVPDASELECLVTRDGINGFRQSIEARKACCNVRKVRPLRRALAGASGWLTGLRRGQSGGRLAVSLV